MLNPFSQLTPLELRICVLLVDGYSSAEAAAILKRSVKNVDWHRRNIGLKLGVKNRVEIARMAVAHEIVPAKYDHAQIRKQKALLSLDETVKETTGS